MATCTFLFSTGYLCGTKTAPGQEYCQGHIDIMEKKKMTGVELIAQERQRQISVEGWTAEHDDRHERGELINAAESYCLAACYIVEDRGVPDKNMAPRFWPWDAIDWKPSTDPVRNLVKAGALIAAEIDRLQRADS